jgi:hypothetical protein
MKEILERLLTENNEMIMESPLIAHPSPLHAFFITFQKYIQNIAKKR